MRFIDLAGRGFGRLTVIGRHESSEGRNVKWLCRCTCGTEKVASGAALRKGDSNSCGCIAGERKRTHGHAPKSGVSRTYSGWRAMLNRCECPSQPGFRNYGGRGIRVCERWHVFESFLADMGERPPGMEIDRIDVDGPYEPGNCRWVTHLRNSFNKTNSHFIDHDGQRLTLGQWAKSVGLKRATLQARLKTGWSIGDALATPTLPNTGRHHSSR